MAVDTLPLADRTITEVGAMLRGRQVSSRELTEACLARVDRDAERLNTFLAVGDRALVPPTQPTPPWPAAKADRPLLGIPYALKDIFVTRWMTPGSRMAACRPRPARGSWRATARRTPATPRNG